MKIGINKIPLEGLTLKEELAAAVLDLETESINFKGPIKIAADVSRISNAITAHLTMEALIHTSCSRCLDEFEIDFKKNITLNYQVDKSQLVIDLDPDIREEIIIDYPIKPLCIPDCRGLCPKCGKNLNEGGCSCATTQKKAF